MGRPTSSHGSAGAPRTSAAAHRGAQHRRHPLRSHAQRFGVGGAARGGHRASPSARPRPRSRAQRAPRVRSSRSQRRVRRAASARARAGGCGPASASSVRTISLWLSVSGPASSKRWQGCGVVPRAERRRRRPRRPRPRSAGSAARPRPGDGHQRQRAPGARAASATRRRARTRSRGRTRSSARPPRAPPARRAPWRAAAALRWWVEAPSTEKNTKRSTPWRSAASTMRQVAMPLSSSIDPRGWSRIEAARCTTVRTPRSALRNDGGSVRSPSAICTRTRWAPSRRGSRTRQRTSVPVGQQARQQRRAHQAGRAGKQQHASYNMPLAEQSAHDPENRQPLERSEWPT